MKVRSVLLLLLLAACGPDRGRAPPIPGDQGPAITVEVLNANGRAGDARVGARLLRRAGIDVVYFGNADGGMLDSTRIIVRRGSASVGEKVRAALGGGRGRVAVELDSSKLLDVSVYLGADFTPAGSGGGVDFHP